MVTIKADVIRQENQFLSETEDKSKCGDAKTYLSENNLKTMTELEAEKLSELSCEWGLDNSKNIVTVLKYIKPFEGHLKMCRFYTVLDVRNFIKFFDRRTNSQGSLLQLEEVWEAYHREHEKEKVFIRDDKNVYEFCDELFVGKKDVFVVEQKDIEESEPKAPILNTPKVDEDVSGPESGEQIEPEHIDSIEEEDNKEQPILDSPDKRESHPGPESGEQIEPEHIDSIEEEISEEKVMEIDTQKVKEETPKEPEEKIEDIVKPIEKDDKETHPTAEDLARKEDTENIEEEDDDYGITFGHKLSCTDDHKRDIINRLGALATEDKLDSIIVYYENITVCSLVKDKIFFTLEFNERICESDFNSTFDDLTLGEGFGSNLSCGRIFKAYQTI